MITRFRTFFTALATCCLPAATLPAIELGDPAPEVKAEIVDADGKKVDLAKAFAKGYTLVYFYPKADTPGCTKQGCSVRDNTEKLKAKGVRVIGVSGDSVKAQRAFSDKFKFKFTLLADTDKKVIDAFGVPKTLGMPKRQAFLIYDGKLIWKNEKVTPTAMVTEVLAAIEKGKKDTEVK